MTSICYQVVARAFGYSLLLAFVSVHFPANLTGSMFSTMFCVGGLALLLQFPATLLVTRVFNNQFYHVYLVLLVVGTVSMAHPVSLFVQSRRRDERNNNCKENKEYLI